MTEITGSIPLGVAGAPERSRKKSRPNRIAGYKPFVKGDPRIRPGPGRPYAYTPYMYGFHRPVHPGGYIMPRYRSKVSPTAGGPCDVRKEDRDQSSFFGHQHPEASAVAMRLGSLFLSQQRFLDTCAPRGEEGVNRR